MDEKIEELSRKVAEGNTINVCGYFTSEANANFLMDKIAEIVGQKKDGDN